MTTAKRKSKWQNFSSRGAELTKLRYLLTHRTHQKYGTVFNRVVDIVRRLYFAGRIFREFTFICEINFHRKLIHRLMIHMFM